MKFKIIINYKSVRECYMAINPMIRKILYSFIGTSLVMSIVFPFFLMNFYLWHFLPNQRKKYFSFLMCHMLFIKKNKPLSP